MQAAKQQGLTFIGLVIVLGFIGMITLSVLKVFPVYMEHLAVQTSMEAIEVDPRVKNMSVGQIRELFRKKLDMNQVTSVSAGKAKIGRGIGELTFVIEYEVRKDYFANIDLVLSFKDEFAMAL
ncbi:DUF4845 domain-containing protein [Cycloclasticus sp. 46_120_T64]|nr:DUF4845 domain-containing protein [Cycloclasticus sp. 46_120_T64]